MDSIRIFIKITFVIFCLGLLYYLISLKPGKREVNTLPTTQAPTNTSQQNTTAETSPPTNTNATPKVSETPLSSEANKNFGHKDGMRIFIQNKRFKKDGMMGQYEGPIIAGLPDGYGIFRYDNGDFFVGRYESGLRVDWGMSCFGKTGKVIMREYSAKGDMVQDVDKSDLAVRKSMPVEIDGKKGIFDGAVDRNKLYGYGYVKFADGSIYIGGFKDGAFHGKGNFIDVHHKISSKIYENGKEI